MKLRRQISWPIFKKPGSSIEWVMAAPLGAHRRVRGFSAEEARKTWDSPRKRVGTGNCCLLRLLRHLQGLPLPEIHRRALEG